MSLERAAVAAEAGTWRDCLIALLEAWRPTRAAVLGDAIERVSGLLEDGRPPPTGKKLQLAWHAMAARKDVADIGLLADSSSDAKPSDAELNMDAMSAWPEDPRVGRAMLVKLFAMTFGDRTRAWTLIGNLILRNADERFRPEIENLQGESQRTDNKARNACVKRVVRELGLLQASALGPADEAHLTRVNAAITPPAERRFIDAILADPESDEPRLVYADWLTERGHPRGELIVLQCAERAGTATPKERKRIRELYAQNARALIGPAVAFVYQNLAYSLEAGNIRFDRGLIDDLQLYFGPPAWTFAAAPLIRAIRGIGVAPRATRVLVELLEISGSIRAVRGIDIASLLTLSALPAPTSIEHVGVFYWREQEEPLLAKLAASRDALAGVGLANLTSFDFVWSRPGPPPLRADFATAMPDELWAAPLLAKLERFAFTPNLAGHIASAKKHGRSTLRTITMLRPGWSSAGLEVHLDRELVPRVIEIIPAPNGNGTKVTAMEWLTMREALRNIDGATITEVRVAANIQFEGATRAELDSIAAERFAGASMQVR